MCRSVSACIVIFIVKAGKWFPGYKKKENEMQKIRKALAKFIEPRVRIDKSSRTATGQLVKNITADRLELQKARAVVEAIEARILATKDTIQDCVIFADAGLNPSDYDNESN